ncbi:MAG TPA: DNA methyltransferase [Chloroflexota bacterium]|nr:DNA methyltransferase [Chloroflexota bacterium]
MSSDIIRLLDTVDRSSSPLARLELACQLLAQARTPDEVTAIADVAEAARIYARQARLGLEAQNDAAEVRLRAERRAGELLAQLELHRGGRPTAPPDSAPENLLQPVTGFARPPAVRLEELHITRRQSSQWQRIARLPAPVFDDYLRTTRARKRELSSAGVLELARRHRGHHDPAPAPLVTAEPAFASLDRFDVADASALPWPDGAVDLIVTSPPYALAVPYAGGDVSGYATWLELLEAWLAEMFRVANADWGRLCLNIRLDRDLGGWQPVSADAVQVARSVGWLFRTWILWDKLQAGAGTDRGSIDSAGAPNVTAPVESVLAFYRGNWRRLGPPVVPHDAWLELCGPRGLWRFPGTADAACPAPFPEQLPERCITLFSFPHDVVADPFVGRGTTAALAVRLGRTAWASDRDLAAVAAARQWAARERARQQHVSEQPIDRGLESHWVQASSTKLTSVQ